MLYSALVRPESGFLRRSTKYVVHYGSSAVPEQQIKFCERRRQNDASKTTQAKHKPFYRSAWQLTASKESRWQANNKRRLYERSTRKKQECRVPTQGKVSRASCVQVDGVEAMGRIHMSIANRVDHLWSKFPGVNQDRDHRSGYCGHQVALGEEPWESHRNGERHRFCEPVRITGVIHSTCKSPKVIPLWEPTAQLFVWRIARPLDDNGQEQGISCRCNRNVPHDNCNRYWIA